MKAAAIKIIGAGVDDPDFADKLSRLVGAHDVPTTSRSYGEQGRSTSVSTRTERILPPDQIRPLPKGQALLLATGLPVVLITLTPWYRRPDAEQLATESHTQAQALTQRATPPARDRFGKAA